MMYIVEVPHQGHCRVWSVEDKSRFIHYAEEECYIQGKELLCVYTGKELEEIYGSDENDFEGEIIKDIKKLRAKYGDDRSFYKRFDDDCYTIDSTDEFEAAVDWTVRDLYCCHIFRSRDEALKGLFDDEIWRHVKLREARLALKNELEEEETVISLDKKCVLRALTKDEAFQVFQTEYAKECLENYSPDDLQCLAKFATDGKAFYSVSETGDRTWLYCDDFKELEGRQ